MTVRMKVAIRLMSQPSADRGQGGGPRREQTGSIGRGFMGVSPLPRARAIFNGAECHERVCLSLHF
jgi:hypothetical protein